MQVKGGFVVNGQFRPTTETLDMALAAMPDPSKYLVGQSRQVILGSATPKPGNAKFNPFVSQTPNRMTFVVTVQNGRKVWELVLE